MSNYETKNPLNAAALCAVFAGLTESQFVAMFGTQFSLYRAMHYAIAARAARAARAAAGEMTPFEEIELQREAKKAWQDAFEISKDSFISQSCLGKAK